jgi:hypothetical protein
MILLKQMIDKNLEGQGLGDPHTFPENPKTCPSVEHSHACAAARQKL